MCAALAAAALLVAPATAHAQDATPSASGGIPALEETAAFPAPSGEQAPPGGDEAPAAPASAFRDGREYLVPELAEGTFHVSEGRRVFLRRLAFSPGYGQLGDDKLYAFRFAFNPNSWLGYEAGVGHSPGRTVHAVLNTLSAVVRYPLPWRLQPYGTIGYGMILVFPGESLNADPVTKNTLAYGGGLEAYLRDDIALRFDLRGRTVFGGDDEIGTVAYDYREATLGFAFYRTLH
jgi:opacity protein-like surface antigen